VVVAVVLTWNGREDTLACLASLEAAPDRPDAIVLVDNGSSDGTADAVRERFPDVELVRSEENLGFAGGNNLGLERARQLGADHVLVLNNDAEVEPGAVRALVEEAGRRLDAGSLGSKILFAEPSDLIWFAGARFDPRAGYNGRQLGYRERDDGRYDAVHETDRACGAAMLVPRAVLDAVGGFDEELFLYSEDVEWSLRARRAGYRHYVVPASVVRHRVSAAGGGESSPLTLYYGLRNTLVVCERYAPLGVVGTWRRRLVMLAAHLAQALRSPRRVAGVNAVVAGFRDALRGRLGQRGG
jgi:GT2 family glycosyltransferase